MRADAFSRTARIAAATGLAVTLAAAPGVAAAATPSPSTVDASITIVAEKSYEPGKIRVVKIRVRGSAPSATYRFSVLSPKELGAYEIPEMDGWDCTNDSLVKCAYKGKPTKSPGEVWIAYSFPDKANKRYPIEANVKLEEDDPKPGNNTAHAVLRTGKRTSTGAIAGRVWNDANHNGRQDKGERGVAGARVILTIAVGMKSKVVGRATTGSDGRWAVRHLPAGTSKYAVMVGAKHSSWRFTEPGVGGERGDSDFMPVSLGDNPAGPPYDRLFGKHSVVGIHDRTDVTAGKTTVVDAGLISHGGGAGSGSTLPVTGAGVGGIAGAGTVLLGGGALLTLLARRRRPIAA